MLKAEERISLAGEWRFEMAATGTRGFAHELPGRIHLPGTIDDAGLGPRNARPITLEGPHFLFDYAGPAWYQRDIEIPSAWHDKRVTLFLERCRWVTTTWLDNRLIGSQDSLISPHVYDLGVAITPGRHRLTLCVDNTMKLDLGAINSALYGGTWGNLNGIVGRIELAATPPVWLDDVQVYPNIATKTAQVKVRIGNATGKNGSAALNVGGKSVTAIWDANGGFAEVEVDLTGAKLWDEFAPNLTELVVNLGDDVRTVRFGMREFATRGTQFTLNGRPMSLRGTVESSAWPLTAYPPTDVPAWQRIYRIMKSYGLNHIRFHSWCPPDAAFAAADVEGIMIQAEGPQANVNAGDDPVRDAFIEAELKRIIDTYGNHPSFCMMTLGNEYGGKKELLSRWVDMLIRRDPRHLYSSATSYQLAATANRQWTEHGEGRGIHGAGTMRDLRAVVAADGRPTIGHEIGQWMFYPDFNEIGKWNGVMTLKNFEMVRDDLEKKHLLDLAPQFVQASGRFAVRLYKEEIEVLLRTPGYAGFSLLDLHDYPTQGTAIVGPLDAFWESKGFIGPEAWRRFCAPTVPLLRMPKRTYAADETFEATAELAHYGPADLTDVRPVWTIRDDKGCEVASGKLPKTTALTGQLTSLGKLEASLAQAPAPRKLTVTVALAGTEFTNDWDIWVYPTAGTPQPPDGVTVCQSWTAAQAALADGRKVLLFSDSQYAMKGEFLPVFWSPVGCPNRLPNTMGLLCDPLHPLFAQFPTDIHSDWQWYELMQHSRLFILDDTPPAYRPILQVVDNFSRNDKLGVVFEGRVGCGQLLVCGIDLPALANEPAARQFLAGLYAYVDSPAFQPLHEFGETLVSRLFDGRPRTKIRELGGRITASSVAANSAVEDVTDGNPGSVWTPRRAGAKFPHELVVEFPRPVKLSGLTCLPPQLLQYGWIKDYAVYVSDEGTNWGAPVAQGAFAAEVSLQTIYFAEQLETQFVKLVALSGLDPCKPYASLAELSVITEAGGAVWGGAACVRADGQSLSPADPDAAVE